MLSEYFKKEIIVYYFWKKYMTWHSTASSSLVAAAFLLAYFSQTVFLGKEKRVSAYDLVGRVMCHI